jgi:ankyrin repeat protein
MMDSLRPLIRPTDLPHGRRYQFADGTEATTDDVFDIFVASRDGDVDAVKRAVARHPALAMVEYNYTPPIHFAVREGHREIAGFLLDRGADPAYRSYPFSESLLTFAEDRGHDAVATLLRERLAQRFAISPQAETLIAAAAKGDVLAVDAVLTRHPELVRVSNETGNTALHQAARHGHVEIVRTLIAAGAPVDAIRGDGFRPVHTALMAQHHVDWPTRIAIVNLLLANGAQYTPFIAAMRDDDAYVREAVARDAALANFEDTCHHRVLSAAVRRSNVALTRFLLEHGADPNLPEEGAPHGHALWQAVWLRQREIIDLLLARGADPNAMVESSGSPMMLARKDPELTALLIEHGGIVSASPRDQVGRLIDEGQLDDAERLLREHPEWLGDQEHGWGDGILAGPANAGRHDVIEMLLRVGARVPLVSKWAPYYYFKHEETAAFLLDRGMDPNHMNWHRFTLLHHMAAEGEMAKACLLLDHGAAIDAIDDEYLSTPLGVAARRGQQAMVDLLLERGANATAAGAPWAVPRLWAQKKGHQHLVPLLS